MAKKDENRIGAAEMAKALQTGETRHVYLFFGEEDYLKNYFTRIVCARYEADRDSINYLDGKVTEDELAEALEATPLMMTSTVVIVRDSGLFKKGSDDKKHADSDWSFLEDLSDESCVIFKEQSVDRSSKLYKIVEKCGLAFECGTQELSDVVKILTKRAASNGRKITPSAINLLYTGFGKDIFMLLNEVDRLSMLANEGATIDDNVVKHGCNLSMEAKIFDLTDGIAEKNKQKALEQLNALAAEKVPYQVILSTIATHFIKLGKVMKLSEEGLTVNEITEKSGMRDFQVKKYLKQARGYTAESVDDALSLISDTDVRGKNGTLDIRIGLELLIQEIGGF